MLKKDTFIKNFSNELKEQNVAIFAGAGMSIPAGHLNWKDLLKPLADEINIDIEREENLVSIAQFYANERSRSAVSNRLLNEFSKTPHPTVNHNILARLPISTYWTTNYDSLIEDALSANGKIADVKYTTDHLSHTRPNRDAIVYKMHGDKNHPSSAILLKDDYETYSVNYGPFLTALQGDLTSKTFLFIGISFSDPNLDYILSRLRILYGSNQRTHYAFIKKLSKNDCLEEEYEYLSLKQKLFINDLKRYNIEVILIDEYNEITEILTAIEKMIYQDNIFISGSADTYHPFCETKAQQFITDLSSKLIELDKKIVSGFGQGVGNLVVTGALKTIYVTQGKKFNNQLILRPFPIPNSNSKTEIKKLWKQYRTDMITLTGISIFIFGNKQTENGETVKADGVYEEFLISKERGNLIIPVGATGWTALQIWNEVNSSFDTYYPNATNKFKNYFQQLNDPQSDLISTILNIINEHKKSILNN